jgi:two-component system alkaline phosphatase synthesis response regulator PhoP
MSYRILIVDDEPSVTNLLAYNLRQAHYEVFIAANGRDALQQARDAVPDLILLDVMIPEIDGLDVCRKLRKTSDVPIIMITARGEETDRVVGLELGADDYVCKPFSVRELMARVKAVLRRTQTPNAEPGSPVILNGPQGLRLDTDSRTANLGGSPLNLTRLEFDLLHHLLLNAGRVLTRERLLEQAWGYDYAGDTRAVDSTIKRLRAKLRASSAEKTSIADPDLIEAVRGIGYRLKRS